MRKKKQTNDEKIIKTLVAIDKSIRDLGKFKEKYDSYIDEAFMREDEQRVVQLIKQKVRVGKLIDQLGKIKSQIELGAFSAQAISELGTLPEAIAACKGIMSETPNFEKLGKSLLSVFKDIDKSEVELEKLNEILDPKPALSLDSKLGTTGTVATKDPFMDTPEYKKEFENLCIRIRPILEGGIPKPDAMPTDNMDLASIMRRENEEK